MKQLLLTSRIKSMAKKYAKELFADKRSDFIQPVDGLKNLIIDLQEVNDSLAEKDSYIKYLETIILDYPRLKNLNISKFTTCKRKYDKILEESKLTAKIKYRSADLPSIREERDKLKPVEGVFYEQIVNRMHYKDARLYLAPYMKMLGVQTCVYCNNSEAVYSDGLDEAYYHFDHWLPKDKYPFLCVCFYNLYPCCSNCNGHKLDGKKGSFCLYSKNVPVFDPFVFLIDRSALKNDDAQTLSVLFNARNKVDNDFRNDYNTVFRIEQFYNSPAKKRSCLQLIKLIDKHKGHYLTATDASVPGIADKDELWKEVLGVDENEENIFTDVNKKLKIDTAKDAKLI